MGGKDMFFFELKKLFKRKILIFIILFAIIMAYYNIHIVSSDTYTIDEIETEENPYNFMVFKLEEKVKELNINDNEEKATLLEGKIHILRELIEERRLSIAKLGESYNNGDEEQDMVSLKSYEALLYFDHLVKEYKVDLTDGQKDAIYWNLNKLALILENPKCDGDLKYGKNLGRFLRFGADNLFSIMSILVLAFFSLNSLPSEIEEGTIVTLYTQPHRRWKVILSKFLSFISMSLLYVLGIIFFTLMFCVLKNYPLTGLNSISRILTTDTDMMYLKTWEYFAICILCFLVLNLFIYSIILFIGNLTKSSIKTILLVAALMLMGYMITYSGYMEYIWNPFYLLNYSQMLLGKYLPPSFSVNETVYTKVDAIGYIPYLYILLPVGLFLVLTFMLEKRPYVKIKNEKSTGQGKKISSLIQFELKKIKESNSTLSILLSSLILLVIIFSIVIVDDIRMISTKTGHEGEVAFRKKVVDFYIEEINYLEELAANPSIAPATRKQVKEQIKHYRDNLARAEHFHSLYGRIYDYYDKKDSEKFYNELLKTVYTKFDKDIDGGMRIYKGETGEISEFAFITSVERIKELRDRKIVPILQTERQDTAYDEYIDNYRGRLLKKHYQPLTHSGLYSIYRMNKEYYLSYIIFGFILMFFCGGYAYDTEVGNQLVFLYTEPINRREYHYTKILSSFLYSAIYLLLFYIAVIIFGWISEGLGQWNYPILHYDYIADNIYKPGETFENTYHFINLSSYILRLMIMSLFSIGFLASLAAFLSLGLKKKNQVIFATVIICFIGNLIVKGSNIDFIKIILPFTYMNVGAVADGAIKIIYNSNKLTMFMGAAVLSLWIMVLTALGMDIVEKREV